jgi:hypothetical protein
MKLENLIITASKQKKRWKKFIEQIIYWTLSRSLLEYAKENISNKKIMQVARDYQW